MTRSGHIFFNLVGLLVWLWLGYENVALHTKSETIGGALLSPAAFGPIVLVPLTLGQLSKWIFAEREENVLNPHFMLSVSQSLFARGVMAVMCLALLIVGGIRLSGSDLLPGEPGSFSLNLLFVGLGAFGTLSALTSPLIRLRLSPDGLEFSMLRPSRVSWHDVTEVRLRSVLWSSWVVLTLKQTTEHRSAALVARWRKVAKVRIDPVIFGIDPEVLSRGIEARRSVFTF